MSKTEIRNDMKQRLAQIEHDEYIRLSSHIKEIFLKEVKDKKVDLVGLTISNFPEVDTKEIISALWTLGKRVAIPRCSPKERTMTYYVFQDFNELEQVYMNLWEPIPTVTTKVSKDEIDLLVVPGIVYSKSGYRIGYGGGYFDRFLVNYKGETVSLAFDRQLTNAVPIENYDLPVSKIITETKIINCEKYRKAGAYNEDSI